MSEPGKPALNPCTSKPVCTACHMVEKHDRPGMCIALQCQHYLPCPRCGINRTLHQCGTEKICKKCISSNPKLIRELKKTNEGLQAEGKVGMAQPSATGKVEKKVVSITMPGEPPPELNAPEKEYYNKRWADFKGYYRDPAAYFVCHQLVLFEIHIQYLNSQLMVTRGELHQEVNREIGHAIQTLKQLKDQLPDKESQEMMDDEKALCAIYEDYVKVTKARSVGRVSRLLSPAAIALAPRLEFPVETELLMRNLGYQTITIEKLLPRLLKAPVDRTPEEIMQFFGFELDEEYAMEPDSPLLDSEEILANLGDDFAAEPEQPEQPSSEVANG